MDEKMLYSNDVNTFYDIVNKIRYNSAMKTSCGDNSKIFWELNFKPFTKVFHLDSICNKFFNSDTIFLFLDFNNFMNFLPEFPLPFKIKYVFMSKM